MQSPMVKYGLYLGAVLVAYTMILYLVSKAQLFSIFLGELFPLGIGIAFMVMAGLKERDLEADGLMSYGDAVKVTFVTKVIGGLILAIFTYILFAFIDPDLVNVLKEQSIETAQNFSSIFGADEGAMDAISEELNKQDFSYGFGTFMLEVVGTLVGGIFLALIVAIFVKRS